MANTDPPVLSIGITDDDRVSMTVPTRWENIIIFLAPDVARAYAKMMVTAADSIDGGEDEEDEIQN